MARDLALSSLVVCHVISNGDYPVNHGIRTTVHHAVDFFGAGEAQQQQREHDLANCSGKCGVKKPLAGLPLSTWLLNGNCHRTTGPPGLVAPPSPHTTQRMEQTEPKKGPCNSRFSVCRKKKKTPREIKILPTFPTRCRCSFVSSVLLDRPAGSSNKMPPFGVPYTSKTAKHVWHFFLHFLFLYRFQKSSFSLFFVVFSFWRDTFHVAPHRRR